MLTVRNFDGHVALDTVQQLQKPLGTGILSGCLPSLPTNTSPIAVDVGSGTAYVANAEIPFGGSSIQLPDGDSQYPRKDVVYIDPDGILQSIQGVPRSPLDGTPAPGTDREVFQPEPPDLSSLSSIANAAVVAEVWIPKAATSTADMTDTGTEYVRDRRLRPWSEAVQTQDSVNSHGGTHFEGGSDEIDVAELAGGLGSANQVPQTDGTSVSWTTLSHGALGNVTADQHHSRFTNEEARDAVGAMATDGLVHDDAANDLGLNVVASGSVTLSNGSATISTGVSTSTVATFNVFLGPATNDADIAAEIRADSGSGNYEIDFIETETNVSNPSVRYDITRLR